MVTLPRSLLAVIIAGLALSVGAGEPPPVASLLAPLQAVRANDLAGWFTQAPAAKRAEAAKAWQDAVAKPDPEADAKLDQGLALLTNPQAAELLAVLGAAQLKQVNMQELGLVLSANGSALIDAVAGADAVLGQSLRLLLSDVAAWLPTAGLDDPAKLRAAMAALSGAVQALRIASAAELRALALDDVFRRLGPALAGLKQALAVYDVHADRFLDSLLLTEIGGAGDQRSVRLTFTAFARQHALPLKLRLVDGAWEIDPGVAGAPVPVAP